MASENETVEIKDPGIEDVLNELRGYDIKPPPKFAWLRIADMLEGAWKREIDVYKVGIRHLKRAKKKLTDENKKLVEKLLSDESAWRCEKAELRECLKEAIEREGNRNTCYPRCALKIECMACVITKWRKALEGANATVAEEGEK